MTKILWVDDDFHRDLTERRISLLMQDDLDLHFASDATDAYFSLVNKENKYDVVILDLQHPPGPHDMWNPYREKGERKYGAVLLKLVRRNLGGKFGHLKNTLFGMLSILPREVTKDLLDGPPISLPKENYMVKTDALDDENFLDFIRNRRFNNQMQRAGSRVSG